MVSDKKTAGKELINQPPSPAVQSLCPIPPGKRALMALLTSGKNPYILMYQGVFASTSS